MSMRGGGGRGGRGGRLGGASSFIVQSYKNLMRGDGPLGAGLPGGWDDGGDQQQQIYPQLARRPQPPAVVKDLKFMVAAKRDLESRFAAAEAPRPTAAVTRGAQQPQQQQRGRGLLAPNSAHFPAELDWLRRRRRRRRSATETAAAATAAKRPRRPSASVALLEEVDGGEAVAADGDVADADAVAATATAKVTPAAAGSDAGGGEDDEEGDGEDEGAFENDEELDDNDYVDAYFDNGEGYGAEEAEEDLDGESWYY